MGQRCRPRCDLTRFAPSTYLVSTLVKAAVTGIASSTGSNGCPVTPSCLVRSAGQAQLLSVMLQIAFKTDAPVQAGTTAAGNDTNEHPPSSARSIWKAVLQQNLCFDAHGAAVVAACLHCIMDGVHSEHGVVQWPPNTAQLACLYVHLLECILSAGLLTNCQLVQVRPPPVQVTRD